MQIYLQRTLTAVAFLALGCQPETTGDPNDETQPPPDEPTEDPSLAPIQPADFAAELASVNITLESDIIIIEARNAGKAVIGRIWLTDQGDGTETIASFYADGSHVVHVSTETEVITVQQTLADDEVLLRAKLIEDMIGADAASEADGCAIEAVSLVGACVGELAGETCPELVIMAACECLSLAAGDC